LWSKTPPDEREQKYAGTCLWYQIKLVPEEEYEARECESFFERIHGYDAPWHFDYKIKRDGLRDAYLEAKEAQRIAKRSNIQSWLAFLISAGVALTEMLL
tara:strand:+ start:116 stop:415 length:300 start_codon:yes stop_codon:yes gene_type:complete